MLNRAFSAGRLGLATGPPAAARGRPHSDALDVDDVTGLGVPVGYVLSEDDRAGGTVAGPAF